MKKWELSIIPETRQNIAWRLMTPRFYRRFPNETMIIRAENEERARQIATDEFPPIMASVNDEIVPLTLDQLQPWNSNIFSSCVLEGEDETQEEGIV